jgi:hypothetical protein
METKAYDFSGWATKNDLLCGDGRTIRKDAFKHNDGETVPLVWNHRHNDPNDVLGHALLENRDDGVYAYCTFNDSPSGKQAKELVQHGDVKSLSIYANKLKQIGMDVIHGSIRELSLVLAGANPGAFIDFIVAHDEEGEDSFIAGYDENIMIIQHADEPKKEEKEVAEEAKKDPETKEGSESENEETVADVYNAMSEKQKTVVHVMVAAALDKAADDENNNTEEIEHSEGGTESMKQNAFDNAEVKQEGVLTHSDQESIIAMAKGSNIGSLKMAMDIFTKENESLSHAFVDGKEGLDLLLPDYKNLNPGAPEILRPDQQWVMSVINKIHKSPYSRIRTRHADARVAELKAKGYQKKGDQKTIQNTIKMLTRTFDPQTVYVKDELHRDDIIDITDFDQVAYIWRLMNDNMYETLALAALVGDGREDDDPDKIHENHIRSIWNDEELYTIHADVDVAKAKTELQGTNTGANFSENYIYAEAIIMTALYAREKFKGSGQPDFYCAPHLVNVMLLARDLNGRRIYDSKADLAKALNVGSIIEIEQLADKTRTLEGGGEKKLLGLFVNLADYQFGSTKGGEVTKFEDFDIDFNKHKYLLETRLSGALTKPYAAIALEEPVVAG